MELLKKKKVFLKFSSKLLAKIVFSQIGDFIKIFRPKSFKKLKSFPWVSIQSSLKCLIKLFSANLAKSFDFSNKKLQNFHSFHQLALDFQPHFHGLFIKHFIETISVYAKITFFPSDLNLDQSRRVTTKKNFFFKKKNQKTPKKSLKKKKYPGESLIINLIFFLCLV